MITHYLPRWLLEKFRNPGLYELDCTSGSIKPRKTEKAGSGADLWPEDVEKGLMGEADNAAAQIYRKALARQNRIELSDVDRKIFAKWLVLFMPRVPATFETLRSLLDAARTDPAVAVQMVFGDPDGRAAVLEMVRTKMPDLYTSVLAESGKALGEVQILVHVAELVMSRQIEYCPQLESAYHNHLRKMDTSDMAEILCRNYQWIWLRSNHGFVLGDNPLIRWHIKTKSCNVGIRQGGVEITMPLGKNLCLLLQRPQTRYRGQLLDCSTDETRRYNLRQRLAAENHVYAGEPSLLEPLKAVVVQKC